MTSVNMSVPVAVDFEDIAHELTSEQAEELIMAIDNAQCEVNFSENIIKRLAEALKPCYDTVEEYEDLLESLK